MKNMLHKRVVTAIVLALTASCASSRLDADGVVKARLGSLHRDDLVVVDVKGGTGGGLDTNAVREVVAEYDRTVIQPREGSSGGSGGVDTNAVNDLIGAYDQSVLGPRHAGVVKRVEALAGDTRNIADALDANIAALFEWVDSLRLYATNNFIAASNANARAWALEKAAARKTVVVYAGRTAASFNIEGELTAGMITNFDNVVSVRIGTGVTSIGSGAFRDYTGLTNVVIPTSVSAIGAGAFRGCTGLESMVLPLGISELASQSFSGCTSLTNVVIPASVTRVRNSVFYNCTSLREVVLPDSVGGVGGAVFQGCTSLSAVTLPSNMQSIKSYTFYGCTSLTDVTVPYGVTRIDANAFGQCRGLTSLTISPSVRYIDRDALQGCAGLANITFVGRTFAEAEKLVSALGLPAGCTVTADSADFTGAVLDGELSVGYNGGIRFTDGSVVTSGSGGIEVSSWGVTWAFNDYAYNSVIRREDLENMGLIDSSRKPVKPLAGKYFNFGTEADRAKALKAVVEALGGTVTNFPASFGD